MSEKSENDDAFDTELFIEELHNLPCIWDYTSNSYSNRITKAKAWESLCRKFYNDFEAKNQKDKNNCGKNYLFNKYNIILHIINTRYLLLNTNHILFISILHCILPM